MTLLYGKLSPARKRAIMKVVRQWADSVVEQARKCLRTDGEVHIDAERKPMRVMTSGIIPEWRDGAVMTVTFTLRTGPTRPKRKRGAK